MENPNSVIQNANFIAPDAKPLETEEFKLEMLDCGPAYTFSESGSMCISCVCGSGCLCGCASQNA